MSKVHALETIGDHEAFVDCSALGLVKWAPDPLRAVSSERLYGHVIPSIGARFQNHNRLCNALAMALLYAHMEDDILVSDNIKTRVWNGYNQLHGDHEMFQTLLVILNNLEQLINNVAA